MKNLVAFVLMSFCTVSYAAQGIEESNLSERHQQKIIQAVELQCGNFVSLVQEPQSTMSIDKVDQGVWDYYFNTILTGRTFTGQLSTLEVKSAIFDSYDHTDKDWGVIVIESLNCSVK